MSMALRILVLEDDPNDAELEIATLEKAGYSCQWKQVETREDFLACLDAPDYDLILSDYSLPSFDGLTALSLVLEREIDIPFILVSGTLGEEAAIDSLKAGATDYVLKSRLSRLVPVVERALKEHAEHQEHKRAEEERLALEAQLRQSQKLESVGTLAGGVAHEINNPIMGVMSYAQLIKDELDGENKTVEEFANEIIHESERIATLVKNLLQFARQEKQHAHPTRIQEVVESTLSLIRTVMRRDQITLEIDVPGDLPMVRCHSQQIQQVLMNLVTNARDALNAKYSAYDENKVVRVAATVIDKNGKNWLRMTVEDHGPGIPSEVQERMFDPFYTTKSRSRGTGLGLSITHGIVRDHHGELSIETEPGEYTRFHVDLPLDNDSEL